MGEIIFAATTDHPPKSLLDEMKTLESSRGAIQAQRDTLSVAPAVHDLELRRLEKDALGRLRSFRSLMSGNPDEARTVLQLLLMGRLIFAPLQTPAGKRYEVHGTTVLAALFGREPELETSRPAPGAGSPDRPSPAGFEPRDNDSGQAVA